MRNQHVVAKPRKWMTGSSDIDDVFDVIEWVPHRMWRWVRDLASLKAYRDDPEYKRIEDLRHSTGNPSGGGILLSPSIGLDWEEFDYQREVVRTLTPSLKFWGALMRASCRPRRWWRWLTGKIFLLKHDYPRRARYNFRGWHAETVAEIIADMEPHGHPLRMTFEEWESKLVEVALLFAELGDEPEQAEVDNAFQKLAEIYLDIWD